jgi:hypothetical protein
LKAHFSLVILKAEYILRVFKRLAQEIGVGKIGIAANARIRLFACNNDSNALYFSQELTAVGRADITVWGANGRVSPSRSGTSAFVIDGGYKFNAYKGGKLVESVKSIKYSNK